MAKASRVYGHAISPDGSIAGRVRDLRGGFAGGHIALHVESKEIGELATLLSQAAVQAPAAVARALNRTVSEVRTAMARALVGQTGLKYGVVRSALSTMPASAGSLVAAIVAKGGFTPLAAFGARQTKKGVSAAPWNTRRVFPGTFIVARYGGNVYKRIGRARFPIAKLYGPAIPIELPRDQSRAAFETTTPRVLVKRLDHELGRLLTK